MTTALIYHPDYLMHDTGRHPESAERLRAIMRGLDSSGLLSRVRLVEPQEAERSMVELVHSADHVEMVARACRSGIAHLDLDTPIGPESFRIALLAAGGVTAAVDEVMSGGSTNALALVRPPGHHAGRESSMGFCLFNNVAIGARHLVRHHGLARVAIVDIDVHHGNGTQEIFYGDPTVLYISLHQYPHYPGTGSAGETGSGDGLGTTVNIPLPVDIGDEEYLDAWRAAGLKHLVNFEPEFILVSLGFDAHGDDPLSRMSLSADCFRAMGESILKTAAECCHGRLVSVLEGGYNLRILPGLVADHLSLLLESGSPRPATGPVYEQSRADD